MPGWMIGVIALAFVAGVTAFFLWRKKVKKDADAWKQTAETRAYAIIKSAKPVITPEGWFVYFEKGTDPSAFSLPACDSGVNKTFEKALCAEYQADKSKHNISIVAFNSESDSQGDPAYKVFVAPGSYYYGSEYDKMAGKGQEVDHYILAAGQTVEVGSRDIIVVPNHSGKEDHLARVVEYEMEHVLLAWHDGPKFEETKNHGNGQGHPLIADCPGVVSLMSRPFAGLCGGAVK